MSVIEYKTELGDLCKIKFNISIQDPEIETEFKDFIYKYCRSLPTNKEFKEFGRKYPSDREVYKKFDWLLWHALRAISILSIFGSSKPNKSY